MADEVWYRFWVTIHGHQVVEKWIHYPKRTSQSEIKDDCEAWAQARYSHVEVYRYSFEKKLPSDEWVNKRIRSVRGIIREKHKELCFLRRMSGDKNTRPRYALEPEDIQKVNESLLGAFFAEFDIFEDGSWEVKLQKNGAEYIIIPHSILGPDGKVIIS